MSDYVDGVKMFPEIAAARVGVNTGAKVAISADGTTAVLASWAYDNVAYVLVREGVDWVTEAELTPSDAAESPQFGWAVAVSADGNTVLVSGPTDGRTSNPDPTSGAVWVFVRSGASWSQQGSKIAAPSPDTDSVFGTGVALSADGNTALVGDYREYRDRDVYNPFLMPTPGIETQTCMWVGSAYVFVRSGTTWTEQAKLFPDDDGPYLGGSPTTGARFGEYVDLSADGNVAIICGPGEIDYSPGDPIFLGAFWTYTRTGTTWTVATDKVKSLWEQSPSAPNRFASGVAISPDGLSATVLGATVDPDTIDPDTGADVWFYSLTAGAPTFQIELRAQEGALRPGVDDVTISNNGVAVGCSAEFVPSEDSAFNCAWLFVKNGTWGLQGQITPPDDMDGDAAFGRSASLTPDAILLVGGPMDGGSPYPGAAWVFGSIVAVISVSLDVLVPLHGP